MFYKYIFCKSYFFCKNVFREREFPQIWAGSVIAILLSSNIIVLLELIEFIMLPRRINIFYNLHPYFALIIWAITLIFIHVNKRYLKIIESCGIINKRKQVYYRVFSILYYLISVIAFFIMSDLLREYDITHLK